MQTYEILSTHFGSTTSAPIDVSNTPVDVAIMYTSFSHCETTGGCYLHNVSSAFLYQTAWDHCNSVGAGQTAAILLAQIRIECFQAFDCSDQIVSSMQSNGLSVYAGYNTEAECYINMTHNEIGYQYCFTVLSGMNATMRFATLTDGYSGDSGAVACVDWPGKIENVNLVRSSVADGVILYGRNADLLCENVSIIGCVARKVHFIRFYDPKSTGVGIITFVGCFCDIDLGFPGLLARNETAAIGRFVCHTREFTASHHVRTNTVLILALKITFLKSAQ